MDLIFKIKIACISIQVILSILFRKKNYSNNVKKVLRICEYLPEEAKMKCFHFLEDFGVNNDNQ